MSESGNESRPVVDTEAEGLPGTADDDSTAYDDAQSARIADGPEPAALPADRPIASLDYGTTPAEARTPEPLDDRLAREEPDPTLDPTGPVAGRGPGDVPGTGGDLGNDVTDFDVDLVDDADPGTGRLVQPDEGAHPDAEGTEIAADAGLSGGGLTAEEAAMHEER